MAELVVGHDCDSLQISQFSHFTLEEPLVENALTVVGLKGVSDTEAFEQLGPEMKMIHKSEGAQIESAKTHTFRVDYL